MTKSQWIEQADREAAAAYMKRIRDTRWSVEGILNGGCDNTSVVIAFARPRPTGRSCREGEMREDTQGACFAFKDARRMYFGSVAQ